MDNKALSVLVNRAIDAHNQGDLSKAEAYYRDALLVEPRNLDIRHLLSIALIQAHQFKLAYELLVETLQLNAEQPDLLSNLAFIENHLGQYNSAEKHAKAALNIDPDHESASINIANALRGLNEIDSAISCLKKLLGKNPDHLEALNNIGLLYLEKKEYTQAKDMLSQASKKLPNSDSIQTNLAIAHLNLNEPGDAADLSRRALASNPKNTLAKITLAKAEFLIGNQSNAIELFESAIQTDKTNADIYVEYAKILTEINDFERARTTLKQCLKPTTALFVILASTERSLGSDIDALRTLKKAASQYPKDPLAWYNLGVFYTKKKQHDHAIEAYKKAVDIDPSNVKALNNLAYGFSEIGDFQKCINTFSKALLINPTFPFAKGTQLFNKLRICDWTNYDDETREIEAEILNGKIVSNPFSLIAYSRSPEILKKSAELYATDKQKKNKEDFLKPVNQQRKFRIGYVSSDFHAHATSHLVVGILERHDRSKFEIYVISYGPITNDPIQQRIRDSVQNFIDISNLSDLQALQALRALELDIAIDLKGYTKDSRPEIFLSRISGIQINFLGYPGTLGNSAYDYIIADGYIIPNSQRSFYSEQVVDMGRCYQPNDSLRERPPQTPLKDTIPKSEFIFGSFNNNYKISPIIFQAWIEILKRCSGSVIWIYADNLFAIDNLKKEFGKSGLGSSRYAFATRTSIDEHLNRHRYVDLFLDTFPCNAHTTASDALFMGVPILTISGSTFASRVCGSLLQSVNCSYLICNNVEEYVEKAVFLFKQKDTLQAIANKLCLESMRRGLFDTSSYTRKLESIFIELLSRP